MFRPKVDKVSDKYSWNLYKFYKKYKSVKVYSDVKEGWQWQNIFMCTREDGNLILGKHLNYIMWNNYKCTLYNQYKEDYPYDITEEFLKEYERVGRCLVLPLGDAHKFILSEDGKTRECEYCGKVEKLKERVVEYWSDDECK